MGDPAYPLFAQLLTSFTGVGIGSASDAYNFFHSQLRITIERTFGKSLQLLINVCRCSCPHLTYALYIAGILVARWGVLWRHLEFSLDNDLKLIQGLMRLHNFCMENSIRRGEEKRRQVALAMVDTSINLGEPTDADPHGERLADDMFATAATGSDETANIVRPDLSVLRSGDESRRRPALLRVAALGLKRPPVTRVRASDFIL